MYETSEGPGKDSMAMMKKEISSRCDSYKQRYNALAIQYNATFGQPFGTVPSI